MRRNAESGNRNGTMVTALITIITIQLLLFN